MDESQKITKVNKEPGCSQQKASYKDALQYLWQCLWILQCTGFHKLQFDQRAEDWRLKAQSSERGESSIKAAKKINHKSGKYFFAALHRTFNQKSGQNISLQYWTETKPGKTLLCSAGVHEEEF